MAVIPVKQTAEGWAVVSIHGPTIIPEYSREEAAKGLLTEEDVRREIDIDWTASSGMRVFPEFGDIHCARETLPYDPEQPLICGWDIGPAGTHAFVPTQINHYGQWLIYPELVAPEHEATGIWEFGCGVAEYLMEEFGRPSGRFVRGHPQLILEHYSDPAGNMRPPRSAADSDLTVQRSAFELLRDGEDIVLGYDERGHPKVQHREGWGWVLQSGAVGTTERIDAIRSRLTSLRNGLPLLLVDPGATLIIEGFRGAYQHARNLRGGYDDRPMKNIWSHPIDAIGYCATRLFNVRGPDTSDEQYYGRNPGASRRPGAGRRMKG